MSRSRVQESGARATVARGRQGASESGRELAREVLIHGPISRAELGRRLGLSPASLTRLSRPFLEAGLFVEGVDRVDGAVGRPTRPLDVRVGARRFVGIKLTGDGVDGVLTDLRANPLSESVAELDSREPDRVVDTLARLVGSLSGSSRASAVGVSLGGKVEDGRRVVRAPFLAWRDVDLGGMLGSRLGLPVVVENDVVALAAAEHWFGRGRGLTDFAVVTIGAGVGYGLVWGDRAIDTGDTGLGLGGHLPLSMDGPACTTCGRACSSSLISIPGIEAAFASESGRRVSYSDILELASEGHRGAAVVVDRARRALGRMIALVANLAMVTVVVVAGEGLALLDGAMPALSEIVRDERDPDAAEVRLLVDDSGFTQWARGAAAAAIQDAMRRFVL